MPLWERNDCAVSAANYMLKIKRGDIVLVDLQGAKGCEKQHVRPCLIVQNDMGNAVSPLTIIVPITDQRQGKKLPVQVPVPSSRPSGLVKNSVIECGHIRVIDRAHRIQRVLGTLPTELMHEVDRALSISLGLAQSVNP